jgi:hypothetical protein
MATLSSNSTDAEVWTAYDDSASYDEDGSRAKHWRSSPLAASRGGGFRFRPAAGRSPSPANRSTPKCRVRTRTP